MAAITKTEEKIVGYGCDICGKKISDNQHDGAGGINWWGMFLDSTKEPMEEIKITRERTDMFKLAFRSYQGIVEKPLMVCFECMDEIKGFITKLKAEKGK